MTLLARIFPLLLLCFSLLAQDATEPVQPANSPAVGEAKTAEPDQPPNQVNEVPDPEKPTWDPVTEEAKEPKEQRRRRARRDQHWGPRNGNVVFGQKTVVAAGEKIYDLVLFGGSADIQGEVERDVIAIGGSVKVSGKVGGDVVVIGGKGTFSGEVNGDTVVVAGRADVAKTARLDHDAVFIGGPFKVSEEAEIGGERTLVPFGDLLPQIEWFKAYLVRGPLLGRWLTFSLAWPWLVAGTFVVIYFGFLLAFPAAARAVYTTLEERPVTSIFTGLLTMILFAPLTFLLIISLVGILVIPFLKISLLLALVFGKIGVFCFLGRGLARTSGTSKFNVPVLAFFAGAIILMLTYAIPLFGIFAWAMATVFGLGGAIVALFGTFQREEAMVPPATVLASTVTAPPASPIPNIGSAPAAAAPIPGTMNPPATATPPPDVVLLPRAGFWARFVAALVDLILVSVVIFVLPVIGFALFIPCAVAYFTAMWTWQGATIGGLMMGHKVVRTDGRPVDFMVAVVRSLMSIVSTFCVFLGCLWCAWDRQKQTWHDKIAGTVVVKVPRGLAQL
jgi:uncharacterized RDD family membrane protein YckC